MHLGTEVKPEFELSESHKMLKQLARDFAIKEIAPLLPQIDREDELPEGFMKKYADAGLLGITVPPEYGGPGEDYVGVMVVDGELTRYGGELSHSVTCMHNLTVCDTINLFGTEEQRKRWLPRMVTGEKIGIGLYSELEAGSDVLAIEMTATKDGDSYLLNGNKNFMSAWNVANTAITWVRTKPEAGDKGITTFILDMEKGNAMEKENTGKLELVRHKKMGSRGEHCYLGYFDNYRVPAENVLGNENDGVRVMMTALGKQRPLAAMRCVGHIWMALDASIPFAKKRVQFGKPISEYQLTREKLANMYTMAQASEYLVMRAAEVAWEAYHVRHGEDRSLISEVNKLGSAAKLISCRASRQAVLDAYQIHGGNAYDEDYPVNRILRDGLAGSLAGGSDEMMILNLAEELLRG